jgi:hypothetical protein
MEPVLMELLTLDRLPQRRTEREIRFTLRRLDNGEHTVTFARNTFRPPDPSEFGERYDAPDFVNAFVKATAHRVGRADLLENFVPLGSVANAIV